MAVTARPPGRHHPARTAPAPRSERGELGELGRMMLCTVLPTGLALAVVLTGYAATDHEIVVLLQDRDVATSEWSGFLTFVACSALMVCAGVVLSALVVARTWFRSSAAAGRAAPPAVDAGLALAVLLLAVGFDDIFMVHDAVLPGFDIPENVGLALYGVVGLGLALWAFAPLRRAGLALPFLGGLGLLALSLGGDVVESLFHGSSPGLAHVLGNGEDITKYLAYAALCHLCIVLARRVFSRTLQAATDRAALEHLEGTGASGRAPARATSNGSGVPAENPAELTSPL